MGEWPDGYELAGRRNILFDDVVQCFQKAEVGQVATVLTADLILNIHQ